MKVLYATDLAGMVFLKMQIFSECVETEVVQHPPPTVNGQQGVGGGLRAVG